MHRVITKIKQSLILISASLILSCGSDSLDLIDLTLKIFSAFFREILGLVMVSF